ncbi:hypothetical protein ES332_D02G011300v1 [Gossypium tomentosum]|uniref:Disease resistance protein RGA3 n=1 Tax=Gossypium tomentosum TaxID=34277 RepID=A0A5D2LRD3_GOSTO|nr:hypothetical protein ES332_D02G011300v1 [Gossypium tomentosum]TYH81806.1 hypothetical protein ES332_D02G011300v1 [Gossypium tomentosum]TYH81807.1 hypothetical protein ES332_D02G011300v1 [Gossypium tomentosum]
MAEAFVSAVVGEVASKAASVADDMQRLGNSLEMIGAFLQDAEGNQKQMNSVKLWLKRLRDVAYEADEVLDEIAYEFLRRKVETGDQMLRKVRDLPSTVTFQHNMANKVKDILNSLDDLNKIAKDYGLQQLAVDQRIFIPSNVETVSFLDDSNIVGRKNDVSKVVDMLLSPQDDRTVSVVPIVGMAGIGKTTLARLVYHDVDVERRFDVRFWVCVSDDFNVKRILREMLEHDMNYKHTSIPQNLNALTAKLKGKIEQAKRGNEQIKYLLVLDDVWDVEQWDELMRCLEGVNKNRGNKVIVTTRIEDVALKVETLPNQRHQPGKLKYEECWSIIKEKACGDFPISPSLVLIGEEIAKQCHGVPLAAKVIGGTMRKIERSRAAWLKIQKSDVWDSVYSVLRLSFDHLSSPCLKKCFAYCAMFPKDFCFRKEQLIQLWMAEGFLGASKEMMDTGNRYFHELLSNSLFQEVGKDRCGNILTCKMHDLYNNLHASDPIGTTLALSVSKFETLIFQENSISITDEVSHIRHLSIAVAPKLHSLFSEIDVFKKLSRTFTSLRLPASLGELKHLRYMDISKTSIKVLPQSITKLYMLQTLRFMGCREIAFPDGLRNLISLRHLISLQTLPMFFVRDNELHLDALECLNELGGQLKICDLQSVRDTDEAGKANLRLKTKFNDTCEEVLEGLQPPSGLQSLIVWNYGGENLPSWMSRPLELNNCINCKSLPPLGQLQSLKFIALRNMEQLKRIGNEFYCDGSSQCEIEVFPALKTFILRQMRNLEEWTATTAAIMFPCLEELLVSNCPLLESLCIEDCSRLSSIGDGLATSTVLEELTIVTCGDLFSIPNLNGFSALRSVHVSYCGRLAIVPIAGICSSLKEFCISKCNGLSKIGEGLSTSICLEELKLNLEEFSSLRILDISNCRELKIILISSCPKLSKIGDGLSTSTSLEDLKLNDCANLSSIPDLEELSSLRIFDISDCHELETISIRGRCPSLKKLHISSCPKLSKIGDWLSTSTSLEELKLGGCANLSSIPDLVGFFSLRILDVSDYHELETFLIRGRCSSLEKLHISSCPKLSNIGDWLSTSTSFEELKLGGCVNLSSIPDLVGFSSLRIFHISDCHELKIIPLHISSCPKLSRIGDWLSTSTSLEELKLGGCANLSSIPDLCYKLETIPIKGRCSSLRKLHISSCPKLSEIGDCEIGDWLSTSTSLEELKLGGCANLSSIPDLEGISSLRILDISNFHELETIPIRGSRRCSSLKKLQISSCPKLSEIGDRLSTSPNLAELKLSHCGNLNSIPDLEGFFPLHILNISNCNNLEIVRITGRNSTLQALEIIACKKLSQIGDELLTFTRLRKLRIVNCPNLRLIPRIRNAYVTELDFTDVGEGLTRLLPDLLKPNDCLHNLTLSDLPGLRSIPESLGDMYFLVHLTIKRCPTLRSNSIDILGRLYFLRRLDIGGFSEELEEFPGMDYIQHLSATLKELRLLGWENLSSLPHQLQHLTALEELEIHRFHGIEALPDWLGNLSSVKCLRIVSCDKLMYLPSEHVMRSLSKLTTFIISACPPLEARCSKESGPEWSKISHICRTSIIRKRTLQDLDGYE